MDVIGLAVFFPVIALVLKPALLTESELLYAVYTFTGIAEPRMFTLALFLSALFFFIIRSLFIIWSQYRQASFSFDMAEHITTRTLTYLLNLPYAEFSKRDSSEMIRELNTNPQQFSRFIIMQVLLVISELVVLVVIVAGIAAYNLTVFGLLVLSLVPAAFIFHKMVKRRIAAYGREQNELTWRLQEISYQAIFGFVDIEVRNKEKYILGLFSKQVKSLNNIGKKVTVLSIMPAKLFEVLTMMGLFLIFCYGFFISDRPELVLPILTVYLTASYRLIPSLGKVIPALMNLDHHGYLFEIFRPPMQANIKKEEGAEVLTFTSSIQLSNVSFGFQPNDPIIKNLNVRIPKGQTVGFIGRSGSGKTTLAHLLLGLYQPDEGSILVDDVALSKRNMLSWRTYIGYVQQSHFLVRGSLTANVAFGEKPEHVDHERLAWSIQHARLHDYTLGRDPNDVEVDEYGKNLSGGQKQRVVIARALYHKVELLILDEATSALDIQTEQEINDTILELKNLGLTLIIIAHRFTTLRHCDTILELENGQISKKWSYEELEVEAIA